MEKEKILKIFKESKSKSDVCRALGFFINGSGIRKVNSLIKEFQINIDHFDGGHSKKIKYKEVEKICPICGKPFKTKKGHIKEKTTCSHKCSNSYFRSGINNPNWKGDAYRSTCFLYHEKKCIICEEENIVDVHHYDEDSKNNKPENLIPLCPTHHMYMHSRFKNIIENRVEEYVKNFKI